MALAILMITSALPMSAFASEYDASVSGNYFNVISENRYALAPGATETELVLNNAEGSDRKVVHYFEVDAKNENIEVLPGYYGIDKLDPNNLALDGVEDKSQFWKAEQLTKTVAYYENMGYNVVGAMNTALAYDSNAPYGYMVMNGVVLGTPEVHRGAQTYLAIDADGNCELRSMSTPLDGTEVTAISANFNWLVKDGQLVKTTVERTSADASRSMIGIKADGTLVFCQVDGRNAPFSSGLSDYEMGEMMSALGCVNAVNCDGGGSSTFISKREGETENTMRSVPSDGSERATINSVILVSNAKATGEFDHAVLSTDYNYYAPGTSINVLAQGVDAAGSPAQLPEVGIEWTLSDASFGTVENGVFTSNGKKGDVTVQMLYNGNVSGEKLIHIVDPDVFALTLDETVLPYGKSMEIDFACTYGADSWDVCVEGAYTLTLSDNTAAQLNGKTIVAPTDETIKGVDVLATYKPNPDLQDVLKITYGKGSEVIFDFEDGDTAGFVGFEDAKKWSIDNGIENTLVGDTPLANQFSEQTSSKTFVSTDVVRNGKYSLAWSLDSTDVQFASWTYNILFNIGETIVLRDVANGKNATRLGMWLYIPKGAAGLSFQSQFYTPNSTGELSCKQSHFMFTSALTGKQINLNSASEADIPESRWVYASIDLTAYDYLCTPVANDVSSTRSPSFIRSYVKPMVPAVHTFYIDDITLDYSSAVDDRELPTISNISYATADESVELQNGATINGNSVSFSSVIADNVKLDYTTGRILIDGNEIENVTASGKILATTSNVTLTSGAHTVAFEIKDSLGNLMKVTRTFTVAGDAEFTLSGHNDSGTKPECGSIYYVDVNVADITAVNKINVDLLLQNANTWEPQGISVANGFKAVYELDEVSNIISLTVERNGDAVDETTNTVVSVPVRLWSWNGRSTITEQPIAAEDQFKSGYCPVVTIECSVVKGLVNDTKAFGGSISVETMINDTVNPWHYHDTELTVLNKEATCTVDGYTNRTYCETCKSVVDWGTAVEALGHHFVDGKCDRCGAIDTTSGLIEENGNWYYYINGIKASGWQMIGTDWYYFDTVTKIGAEGQLEFFGGVMYTFEHGKLTTGVWAKTLFGTRYYYGPKYYSNRLGIWVTIEGKNYFFDNNGYRLEGGWQLVLENQINKNWYYFDENGVCEDKTLKPADGFYTDRNGYAYARNGEGLSGGEHLIDGKYYYIDDYFGYAQKGERAGRLYGEDYTAYTGLLEKNGVLLYYLDGRTGPCGLVECDGNYYYSYWGGVIKKSGSFYITNSYCDLPAGQYTFGDDGKLANGIFEIDGKYYYFLNGKPAAAGLYNVEGDYYFAGAKGECVTSQVKYAWATHCELAKAEYEFGADGKMLNGVVEKDGVKYLYVNGRTATCGLYEVNGEYYYSYWGGVLKTSGRYYVTNTYCDLQAGREFSFGPDGKMYNGVEEINGVLYLYVNGSTAVCGLFKVDNEYYYSYWGGVLKTSGRYYVTNTYCDLEAGREFSFGPDGKMYNGIEEIDGKKYLYINGTSARCGLYEVDGDYYYSYWGGLIKTSGTYYVTNSYCELKSGNYEFGADGKMLNGLVEKDGKLYYYENGKPGTYGLINIDGDYYLVNWGGEIKTDGTYYVSISKCDLPANRDYMFGADGKMLNGFVTREDGIYYYENGRAGKLGLFEYDGNYYFVRNGNGLIVTNTTYYAWETNGLSLEMNYKFDELGRVIGA